MIPLLGFTPDIDPTTPGAMPGVFNMIPTTKGMKASPTGVTVSNSMGAECKGIAVVQKTSGARRTVAGTQTLLYELNTAGTWGTAGGTYVGSSTSRWSFAQFGDITLASNHADAIQYSTAGTFAAVPGAPKAKILVGVPNFVVALNTADTTASSTFGTSPDRWWCCTFQDPTSWTINATLQAASGRLIEGGGEITAGAPFGSGLVVFKQRMMFLGQYAGPPSVFDFQRIPGDQGCVGMEAVADIGGALFFVGDDALWVYDGSRPRQVGGDVVRRWFFDSVSAVFKKNCIVRYDASNGHVWIFFPFNSSSNGSPNVALVWHIETGKWGYVNQLTSDGDVVVEAATSYVTGGATWNTINQFGATWDSLPSFAWDSESWQSQGRVMAYVGSSHSLNILNGLPLFSGYRSHLFGTEDAATSVSRVYGRFQTQPSISGVCTGFTYKSANSGASGTIVGTLQDGNFDIRQAGRLHQFQFVFNGNVEIIGTHVPLKPAGQR